MIGSRIIFTTAPTTCPIVEYRDRPVACNNFSNKEKKLWKLITVVSLYTFCFAFALYVIGDNPFQIFLSALTYSTLELMTVLMWRGNGKHIRYGQFFVSSPSWIIHNIFNFSLGGILCEVFMMLSVVISFIRYGKDGFEK